MILDITFANPHESFRRGLGRNLERSLFGYIGLDQLMVTLHSTRIAETVDDMKRCIDGVAEALAGTKALKAFSLRVQWGGIGIPALRSLSHHRSFNDTTEDGDKKDYGQEEKSNSKAEYHPLEPNLTSVYEVCPDHITEYFNSIDHEDLAKGFVNVSATLQNIELIFIRDTTPQKASITRRWNVVRNGVAGGYTLEAL
ncbi:hypothetical protein ABKN59_004354 [Abortiporus biennis]